MSLSVKQTDFLNIGLMLLSFGVAVSLPFELFLFSYAVLGPLHYITEINWLDERGYFLAQKRDVRWLVGLTGLVFVPSLYGQFTGTDLSAALAGLPKWLADGLGLALARYANLLVGLAFGLALVLALVRGQAKKYWLAAAMLGLVLLLQIGLPAHYAFFTLMLPSLIHVSVFTALFMLAGTLRHGTWSGYLSLLAYALCVGALLLPVLDFGHYQASDYARQSYGGSGFPRINQALFWFWGQGADLPLFTSPLALRVQALVAFVYTYHYLNWFAKTSAIGWHRVPRGQLVATFALWGACLGAYAYHYAFGLAVLGFLSLLHVVLEFPLNHKVMGQVATSLAGRLGLLSK
jgi:hypothetical protein